MFEGEEFTVASAKRILEFMSKGLPFEPLVSSWKILWKIQVCRVSKNCMTSCFENLPVTEDGCFLAYKAVRSDFKDKWRGTFGNSVGQVCEMRRAKVNDTVRLDARKVFMLEH